MAWNFLWCTLKSKSISRKIKDQDWTRERLWKHVHKSSNLLLYLLNKLFATHKDKFSSGESGPLVIVVNHEIQWDLGWYICLWFFRQIIGWHILYVPTHKRRCLLLNHFGSKVVSSLSIACLLVLKSWPKVLPYLPYLSSFFFCRLWQNLHACN